ncbi:MAG: tRNA-dihydrouridine synthase family protein [Bacteroidales bacterium]|nr:tRNA-dihydrouridine synthase family protein [Bacteroidales bacterium]
MLLLAPLQGYTEVEFRRAWSTVFSGIDLAVSPFIPLAEGIRFRDKHLRDVLPNENKRLPVIPQVLGNDPAKFLNLATRLKDLGYETVNWNLGCPKRTVARKKRGSGILPYPELLRDILEKIIPELPLRLSIKTRLGYENPEEFFRLIEVYNDFPLESLIIHPRTGIQQYEGDMFLDVLDQTIAQIKHPIVFSGDIKDKQSYLDLKTRYPQINDWMIGRGVLSNPMLPEIIINKDNDKDLRDRQIYFHEELYCEIRAKFERTNPTLNKMKDYWSYFSLWFTDSEKIFLKLARMDDLSKFMIFAKRTLKEQAFAPIEGRTNRQVKVGEFKV